MLLPTCLSPLFALQKSVLGANTQNMRPISAVIFERCVVSWGENIYESQVVQKSLIIFVNKKKQGTNVSFKYNC